MAKRRGQETFRDMALSLGLVMGGVLIFVLLIPRGGGNPVRPVDISAPLVSFAGEAPYIVLTPSGLPAFWKPTSITTRVPTGGGGPGANVAELTVGYVVDRSHDRTFAQLEESNAPDAISRLLGDTWTVDATVTITGGAWQQRHDGRGHSALTRSAGSVTVIVSDGGGKGAATAADLRVLAASLTSRTS